MLLKYIEKNIFKGLTLLFVLSLLLSLFSMPVMAQGDINLKVVPGFNGEYKSAQWVPIHITITNNSNKDIDGEIVVETQSGMDFSGEYYEPITVPRNATKVTTIIVPGDGIFSRSKVKFVVKDKVIASEYVGGNSYSADTSFIGILASDKDTGNFLALANKSVASTRIINLADKDISTNSKALSSLDILIINNYSLDGLNEQQIKSIIDWSKQGGSLVLGGGTSYQKLDKAFSEISPITYNGTIEIAGLANLETEAETPINLTEPLTISNGTVKAGEIFLEEAGVPLYVINDVENGKVLYVAYDIAEEPLASWSGNYNIWNKLLAQLNPNNVQITKNFDNSMWTLKGASEKIPSLNLPELNQLAIFFVIYTIVIGPVIYIVLKKRGKHERAWLFIPIFAVLITFGIYQFSNFNRGNEVMVHNVSFLELENGKGANLNAVSAIFVPSGGEYKVKYNGDGIVRPLTEFNYDNLNRYNSLVNFDLNETNITYKNIDYWSLRQAYIQDEIDDVGEIASNLSYQDGKLTGTITNNTKYKLRDVKIIIGNYIQDIGNLAINQSANINISYSKSITNPQRNSFDVARLLPNNLQQNNSIPIYSLREYNMVEMFNNRPSSPFNFGTPTLIAWTDDKIIDAEVLDRKQVDYNITLIQSTLNIVPSKTGEIYYPPGTFKSVLVDNKASLQEQFDGYYFSSGSLYFEFEIDNQIEIDNIKFYVWSHDNYNFTKRIYNYQTKEYELFETVMKNNELSGTDANQYISSNGKLKIEIENSTFNAYNLQFPAISVEGRKKQ